MNPKYLVIVLIGLLFFSYQIFAKDETDKTDARLAELELAVAELQELVSALQDDLSELNIDLAANTLADADHTGNPAAHHVAYTSADTDAALAAHSSNDAAHHVAYTDADAESAVGPHFEEVWRIDDLESLLWGVTRDDDAFGNDTLLFSGMNLQIVNGSGSTSQADGTGNLIVGYNRLRADTECPDGRLCNRRSGSHNLIVGDFNNYDCPAGKVGWGDECATGGMVVGYWSEISGVYASVSGGVQNHADYYGSSISGGWNNKVSGWYSSITGGGRNSVNADTHFATIYGGSSNQANTNYCFIAGFSTSC